MHLLLASLLGLALVCGIVLAQDSSSKNDSDKPAARAAGRAKLTKPWSQLSSLTDAQKEKIMAIHQKANEEVNAIRDKEDADINALLTDEQKAELKTMSDKMKAEQKSKRADARKEKSDDEPKEKDGDDHGAGAGGNKDK
jgi:Spy/CpxP family protein refolding chaperone